MAAAHKTSECEVCMEQFNIDTHVPRVLQCGHTFCTSCLSKLFNEQKNNVVCPQDQQLTLTPSVDYIPKNFALIQTLTVSGLAKASVFLTTVTTLNRRKREDQVMAELAAESFSLTVHLVSAAQQSHRVYRVHCLKSGQDTIRDLGLAIAPHYHYDNLMFAGIKDYRLSAMYSPNLRLDRPCIQDVPSMWVYHVPCCTPKEEEHIQFQIAHAMERPDQKEQVEPFGVPTIACLENSEFVLIQIKKFIAFVVQLWCPF